MTYVSYVSGDVHDFGTIVPLGTGSYPVLFEKQVLNHITRILIQIVNNESNRNFYLIRSA